MAWNPSPEVAVARDAAGRLMDIHQQGVPKCIVFYELDDGRFGYASYGPNKKLCADAGRLAEEMYARIRVIEA